MRILGKACTAILAISVAACGTSSEPFGGGWGGKGEASEAECRQAVKEVSQFVFPDPAKADPNAIADSIGKFLPKAHSYARCVAADKAAEKLVDLVAAMRNSHAEKLEQVLTVLAEAAEFAGALGIKEELAHDTAKIVGLVKELFRKIDGQLCLHGKLDACPLRTYVPWDYIAEKHERFLNRSNTELRFAHGVAFKQDLEDLTSGFVGGNSLEYLPNGPEALVKRLNLIRDASTSIYLVSWSIYNEEKDGTRDPNGTGNRVTDALLEAAGRGVEVKVLVDGQTSLRPHHNKNIDLLEEKMKENPSLNLKVVRFRGTAGGRQFDGNHRKLFIVDRETVITGGRNIGDDYFNACTEEAGGWRDNEMVIEGPAVKLSMDLFADLWNGAVERPGLHGWSVSKDNLFSAAPAGDAVIAVTDQTPEEVTHSLDKLPPVTMSILKALSGATDTVNIQNAYFILTPDIESALVAALERGVTVNILSNSLATIDQKEVAGPILESLQRMLDKGAHIYLQQGNMLHSKIMTVDSLYAWVGTYNIHPRSYWYEGELAVQVIEDPKNPTVHGSRFIAELDAAIAGDLAVAKHHDPEVNPFIDMPEDSILGGLVSRFFFDAL